MCTTSMYFMEDIFIKFGYLINYEKSVGFTAYIIEILKM